MRKFNQAILSAKDVSADTEYRVSLQQLLILMEGSVSPGRKLIFTVLICDTDSIQPIIQTHFFYHPLFITIFHSFI